MAEVFLRRRLQEGGVEAQISSAGLRLEGEPAPDLGVEVLAERGLDLTAHRSRMIDRDLLRSADLVVAMAREHVREAVLAAPDIWPRVFTLKELVRRGAEVGGRAPGESLEAWLARLHAGRNRSDLVGLSAEDDVFDPLGGTREDYEGAANEISALVDRMVRLAWPTAARETA